MYHSVEPECILLYYSELMQPTNVGSQIKKFSVNGKQNNIQYGFMLCKMYSGITQMA